MADPGTLAAITQTQRMPIKYYRREIVNAVPYILHTGPWQMLPHDLPPYHIVFY